MIVNRQRRYRVPVRELEAFLARARRQLGLPRHEVTVCLLPDARIARLNRAFRGKDKPTDVLSFPANGATRGANRAKSSASVLEASPRYLGDIAIAPGVARRNAKRAGRSYTDELRILVLHGLLHLLGYDHETDHGEMNRLESRLRRRLGLE